MVAVGSSLSGGLLLVSSCSKSLHNRKAKEEGDDISQHFRYLFDVWQGGGDNEPIYFFIVRWWLVFRETLLELLNVV